MSNDIVCRLCPELISGDEFDVIDEKKSEMLKFLFLNLDMDISKDPIICPNCAENLQLSFDFRTTCLTNSNYFRCHAYADNPAVLDPLNIKVKSDNLEVIHEETVICKFCLNYFERNSLKEVNTTLKEGVLLRFMFERCLPEIDINVERQLMCQNCQEFLQIQFNFIMTCLGNEEKIRNFRTPEIHRNLSDILNGIKNLKQPDMSIDDIKIEPEDVNIEDYVSDNLLEVKKEEEIEIVEGNVYQMKEEIDVHVEEPHPNNHAVKQRKRGRRRKAFTSRPPPRKADPFLIKDVVTRILNNEITIEHAAKNFRIRKKTLYYHVNKVIVKKPITYRHKRPAFFDIEQEMVLLKYLKVAARIQYGLTQIKLEKLAYEYAALNNKKPYSWKNKLYAKEWWLRKFQAKYKDNFPFLKPKVKIFKRPMFFTRVNVSMIFEEYKILMKDHKFQPAEIWSCAETAVATLKVPSSKGKNYENFETKTITMICAVSASGQNIPPMVIFPTLQGATLGTVAEANPTGWSNNILFGKFFNHFIKQVKSSVEKPVLLLTNIHDDQITIPAIEAAQKSGVALLTVPLHMAHKMQPLERGVFGSLRDCYSKELHNWTMQLSDMKMPINNSGIAALIESAYAKACTSINIINGFRASGFVPLNENVFTDEDFEMAKNQTSHGKS